MAGREVIARAVFTADGGVVGQVIDLYADPGEYLYETEAYPGGSPLAGRAEHAAREWAQAQGYVVATNGG